MSKVILALLTFCFAAIVAPPASAQPVSLNFDRWVSWDQETGRVSVDRWAIEERFWRIEAEGDKELYDDEMETMLNGVEFRKGDLGQSTHIIRNYDLKRAKNNVRILEHHISEWEKLDRLQEAGRILKGEQSREIVLLDLRKRLRENQEEVVQYEHMLLRLAKGERDLDRLAERLRDEQARFHRWIAEGRTCPDMDREKVLRLVGDIANKIGIWRARIDSAIDNYPYGDRYRFLRQPGNIYEYHQRKVVSVMDMAREKYSISCRLIYDLSTGIGRLEVEHRHIKRNVEYEGRNSRAVDAMVEVAREINKMRAF